VEAVAGVVRGLSLANEEAFSEAQVSDFVDPSDVKAEPDMALS